MAVTGVPAWQLFSPSHMLCFTLQVFGYTWTLIHPDISSTVYSSLIEAIKFTHGDEVLLFITHTSHTAHLYSKMSLQLTKD